MQIAFRRCSTIRWAQKTGANVPRGTGSVSTGVSGRAAAWRDHTGARPAASGFALARGGRLTAGALDGVAAAAAREEDLGALPMMKLEQSDSEKFGLASWLSR